MLARYVPVCAVITVILTAGLSCSGQGGGPGPTTPDLVSGAAIRPDPGPRLLLSVGRISVDIPSGRAEVIPFRRAPSHLNVVQWLEQNPCSDCVRVADVSVHSDGTVDLDIALRHPFSSLNFTSFDVRGILMFGGSLTFPTAGMNVPDRILGDGELLNADGYTTLYNPLTSGHGMESYLKGELASEPPPSCILNAFRRFTSEGSGNSRNAFYAADEVTVRYTIIPPAPFVFAYAVDACWAPPITKPVEDPMTDFPPEANCPEPWRILISDLGPGLDTENGQTRLQIDVYNHQDSVNSPPRIEAPSLFEGIVTADLKGVYQGARRYEAVIQNQKNASPGQHKCLVCVESDENDPAGKPWLNLTAYQIASVTVTGIPINPVDITPGGLHVEPLDVAVEGDTAFFACGNDGLHIFDISDPLSPIWIARLEGGIDHVTVSGGYAYVSGGGLEIADIDPPETAHYVASIPAGGNGIAVSGDYAYACGYDDLSIIDISSPESPSIVKQIALAYEVTDVAVSDGYAYATTGSWDQSLVVIDVDPPEEAYRVKNVKLNHPGGYVEVSGDYAYATLLADSWWGPGVGLHVVDISSPSAAHVIKTCGTLGTPSSLTLRDGYAFLSTEYADIEVIDIDPLADAHTVATAELPQQAQSIALRDDLAYLAAGEDGILVCDIDPLDSIHVVWNSLVLHGSVTIAVSDGYVLTGIGLEGLQIIDVEPPYKARLVGDVKLAHTPYDIAFSDGYAYLAMGSGDLQVVDIDPPDSACLVGSFPAQGEVTEVEVSGTAVCALASTSDSWRLHLAEMGPSGSISQICAMPLEKLTDALTVSDGYAYCSGGWPFNLQIIDIDPPESAIIVSTLDVNGQVCAVSGGYAYLATGDIVVVDVSSPESPALAETIYLPDSCQDIRVSGGYAYALGATSLYVIDIDPIDSASVIASCPVVEYPSEMLAVSGRYAYIGGSAGLQIIRLW